MTHFSVGDQVVIRYGTQQGKTAKVLKSLPLDAYKVKFEDGFILFYSGKGIVSGRAIIDDICALKEMR